MKKITRLFIIFFCSLCMLSQAQNSYDKKNEKNGISNLKPENDKYNYPDAGSNYQRPLIATPDAPTNSINISSVNPSSENLVNNINSKVFGTNLFTGAFARQGASTFNADYNINIGDKLQIRMWGTFTVDVLVTVDPQGNIFLPQVGPVKVLGIKNKDLQKVIELATSKIFKNSVFIYANLAEAQPVRIFVGGFVNRPGLYSGTSMDSLLYYLDQAGGIDADRGTFLAVQVKRGQEVRTQISLYDFLLNGQMPLVQLADGDVIFVPALQHTVVVSGLVSNSKRFEIAQTPQRVSDLAALAKPMPAVTHFRVTRNSVATKNIEYFPLNLSTQVVLNNGDELEFLSDKKSGSITVRVEGEHLSAQEYVLPYGAKMSDLLKKIEFSERSDNLSLQLFRVSVKDRQKSMLKTALKNLEVAALTARSGTNDEASLRKNEAELLLQWVDRAKSIEPKGQVVITQSVSKNDLLLENGDVLNVPIKDGLVLISGEVLFPNAVAFEKNLTLNDYIQKAGGFTQNADSSRIVIAHRDGSFTQMESDGWFGKNFSRVKISAGDELLILPRIDIKSRQIFKEMTAIIYQIAVTSKIVMGF